MYKLDSENKVQLVEVKVKKMNQEGAIITSVDFTLAVNDTVVAAGSHLIDEGQKIKPWSRERGL